nr:microtubule-associated protein 70-5-like [Ipomoea batatas]
MGVAQSENKGLRATEQLKDKALEELGNEVKRLEEKLKISENLVEQRNLETKKLMNEKKEALTAQYAAEAALRRVYAEQKEDESIPIESVIAPLEAEIKMYKNERYRRIKGQWNGITSRKKQPCWKLRGY